MTGRACETQSDSNVTLHLWQSLFHARLLPTEKSDINIADQNMLRFNETFP